MGLLWGVIWGHFEAYIFGHLSGTLTVTLRILLDYFEGTIGVAWVGDWGHFRVLFNLFGGILGTRVTLKVLWGFFGLYPWDISQVTWGSL